VPYKHSESRRHKFTKTKYKVTNWPKYNEDLRRRGDITIWFTEEALEPGSFVIVDSTGLKVCGKDERHHQQLHESTHLA